MLTVPQVRARAIPVAARRLERQGRDPLSCTPAEALTVLRTGSGAIACWARQVDRRQFAGWIHVWHAYIWMGLRERRAGPELRLTLP